MKMLSRISFPAAVLAVVTASSLNYTREPVEACSFATVPSRDTVIYPTDAYKQHRIGNLEDEYLPDSLMDFSGDTLGGRNSIIDTAVIVRDSAYLADSVARFKAWYDSLSPRERREYDQAQLLPIKMKQMDSIKKAREEAKIARDSIIEYTPRILETFALPDSMQYKRIISWTLDQDFQKMEINEPDTSYHTHFYDVPFQRKDVNANWLGMSGSPAMYYNYFLRKSDEGVDFYDALESWSLSPRTIRHYNTKTPFTELAYYGTILATQAKESDNLHLFTTQNITPSLNFSLLFDRFGGEGILEREQTINNTFAFQTNYLGKKYMGHLGYIRDAVRRQENGGIESPHWVRDTIVDARDMRTILHDASSKTVKHTVYLDQQLRIPFNFINRIKAKKDSSFVFNADSLDRDITTAFLGHSSELSIYTREYYDKISQDIEREYYHNVFNYDPNASFDSLRVLKLDNKVFLKLQPWSEEAAVSKLNVGVGDLLLQYYDSTTVMPMMTNRNSLYIYGGVEGQVRNNFFWDAKGRFYFAGSFLGDFNVEANARAVFYPFRRARKSPLTLGAHFETNLQTPSYYQEHMHTNHFSWDNSFEKISTTKVQGVLDIPHWKLRAEVGYALLAGNIYYDQNGIATQNTTPMSVFTASLRKEFVLGPFHMDNRLLYQASSNQEAVPVPALAVNLKYFFQFWVKRNVMEMQIGVNGWWNTKWNSPAYNPNVGVFYNQTERAYNNGPYFDIFVNAQWQRVTLFIKYQNFGNGWPLNRPDYFSADRHIVTQSAIDGLKIGVYWPFYIMPGRAHSHNNTRH